VGRALIMDQNRGLLRVYAAPRSGRILGASIVGPRCEHLAHLLAWAIEQKMTVGRALEMQSVPGGALVTTTARHADLLHQYGKVQESC